MRPDVIAYYKRKKCPIPKLIERRPLGVTAGQVEAAAVKTFDEILHRGLEIKHRMLASYVFKVAREINGDEYEKDWELIRSYRRNLEERDLKYKKLTILAGCLAGLVIIDLILRIIL